MLLAYATIAIALFFAMNIGASGAAATMGPVYGSGALKKKSIALLIAGTGALAGAVIGGGEVVKTVGEGIIPSNVFSLEVALVILISATLTLFLANVIGIPLSTSEVTIGSVVGVGIAFQALNVNNVLFIVSFWLIVPVTAFVICFVSGKVILKLEKKWPQLTGQGKWKKYLALLLIITGFIEAFSAGMNNVANAVGPVVGAGLMDQSAGVIIGGIFVAAGAVLFGGKVLETNGKKIISFSLLQGTAVSGTGGGLVIIASIFGIPVPLTQATTSGIVGIGCAQNGFQLWQKGLIRKIIKVWVVSPVISLVMSYSLIHVFLHPNPYMVVLILAIIIATAGTLSLYKSGKPEQESVQH
ncbi:inorganic phosphate transporter family protein [Salipaludibacillus sp. CUR1]|uniref:inorganic phosphate transporter n=1 Tax=Salipaludibacillus sp. CUR1 TaxID=2820003 RepID=UPI001E62E1A4|nr:inorganic phosphate transporter [Salipaludibacillus sp. CUR1]MCE7791146.1 inorganic phosphate transporter family protein [Salipaludibacillus sp. CUR1]